MTTVLHLHIPRTGGISVSRALIAALNDREVVRATRLADLRAVLHRGADVGLVTGHYAWGMHALLSDFVYFTALRDPVERVRSLYDYISRQPVHPHHELFAACPLEELLDGRPILDPYFSNGQVRQLAGPRSTTGELGPALLERAWENLCRDDVIVTFTDRIEEGLIALAQRIRRPVPPYKKAMNRTARTPIVDGTSDRIRELNRLDAELYRRARERFAPTDIGEISRTARSEPLRGRLRHLARRVQSRPKV
jgi:hypothetical protein